MALQVWLPLNGDLHNQGLNNISITNNGTTIDNNGKIGKCMKIISEIDTTFIPNLNTTSLSLSGWFKFNKSEISNVVNGLSYTSNAKSPTGNLIGNHSYGGIGIIWVGNDIYSSGSFSSMIIMASIRTPSGSYNTSSFNVDFDTWIHITITWNILTHTLSLYKNGNLINNQSINSFNDAISRSLRINYKAVYGGNGPSSNIPMYVNDVRIYDHCLSPKEVKEFSKGLILHYKLDANGDGNIGNTNLVKNGWGGIENWDNSNYSTTELPNITGITHSYYNCSTKEYIPIISNHTYSLSCYIKSKTGTGTCYVSLIPHDIDKNQISYQHTLDGFRASSLTTLAQDLKPGDTIIYLTNASGWANPSTHQYSVAIFGYCDSTGYKYPDLVYTRRIYQFGTSTDKSKLDITNNRVTLNNAYSGELIPKGTSICLTGYGSTYYYPITISATNASDWVLKSVNIIPQNINYLKAAKYVRVSSISGYQYLAGITLKDTSASNIIYDCSGYLNNGSIVGTLNVDKDSSRYNYSSLFSSTESNYITIPYQGLSGPYNNKELTFSFWINTQQQGNRHMIFGIVGSYNINIELSTSNTLRVYWAGTPDWSPGITCTLNTWTHIGIVVSSTYIKCFKNGVLIGTNNTTPNWAGWSQNLMIGSDQRIGTYFLGAKLSDFRIYSTLLSDADIKELYDTAGSIDNQGDLLVYEFDEVTNNILFNENYGIISKQWLGGLSKYTQANCDCTLTDNGYRIYRPANLNNSNNGGTNNMWGGFVLDNSDNRFGLTKGHTYIIEFYIKGQSSNPIADIYWTNFVGWGGGGLDPQPTNVTRNNPVVTDFQSDEWKYFYYKFTISDDIYKVCTNSYSSFTQGNTYLSYKGFKFGFGYTNTGTLGTDLYIKDLSMYDITSNTNININKKGIMSANKFIEEGNMTRYFHNKIIQSTQFLEI